MGFYKFTASNAPISSNVATPDVQAGAQSNYIKTKLKPVNTVDIKDGTTGRTHKNNKPGKKVNITTQDTQSPDLATVKLEEKV